MGAQKLLEIAYGRVPGRALPHSPISFKRKSLLDSIVGTGSLAQSGKVSKHQKVGKSLPNHLLGFKESMQRSQSSTSEAGC